MRRVQRIKDIFGWNGIELRAWFSVAFFQNTARPGTDV